MVSRRSLCLHAIVIGLAATLCEQAGSAQSRGPLKDWPASAALAVSRTKTACPDLRGLTSYDFSIESAVTVAATDTTPDHCRVVGRIVPEVGFELLLPGRWNGRLLMAGNGGFAGSIQLGAGQRAAALRAGFAMTATDTGHDAAVEPLATFAASRQKLIDYAFRAVHVTALTAKRLLAAYYVDPLAHAYFDGCSTGGRQGLISAQRFPDDFDGIVVGAPVLEQVTVHVWEAWITRAIKEAPIPTAKLKVLAEKVYASCDATDGLNDGLIDDPRKCAFKPSTDLPRCAVGSDGSECFADSQIRALEKIYGDLMSNGAKLFPGLPVGAEVLAPGQGGGRSGWDPWIVREGQPTVSAAFGETFLKNMAFGAPNPNYDWTTFDFDRDPARLSAIKNVLEATDPDLSKFRARGGKILMYFGWADPALNPLMGVNYYDSVRTRMGASTPEFFRLFMVPGMFHCGGGVGVSDFDAVTPLVNWVEKGTAPAKLTGSRIVDGNVVRSRPLCPYPEVAKHTGTGSVDDAANFVCRAQ